MTATHPLWRPFDPPSAEQVARVRVTPPAPAPVVVVDPDPAWPETFERIRRRLVQTLGTIAVSVTHIGSTSVPGLAAKPVIDIDLIVPDAADEESYLPVLEGLGFVLQAREPDWEQHRMLRHLDPPTNLHVFPVGAVEPQRTRAFRDWLRTHPADRAAYAAHKREVAARGFTDAMDYNRGKAAFVYDLYEKILTADPEHQHDPHPRA